VTAPDEVFKSENESLKEVLRTLIDRDLEFLSLLDGSPAVGYLKDSEGRYVYLNGTARKICEGRLGERRIYTEADLFQGETLEAIRKQDIEILNDGDLAQTMLLAPDGLGEDTFWIVYKFRMSTSSGTHLVAGIHIRETEWHEISEPLMLQISDKLAA
jgi:PAS domain-containing protein